MSRRVEGLLVRIFATSLVVVPLCILFAPGEKTFFWLLLVAIPMLRAALGFAALKREFTADRATGFLGWLAIAGVVVVLYAAAQRLAPTLVHEVPPSSGDFVLTEFRMELTSADGLDAERLALLDGPPQGAEALREWIVYGLACAEAEGCSRERARSIKERARSAVAVGVDGGGDGGSQPVRRTPPARPPVREAGEAEAPAGTGLYREISALARELGGSASRSCNEALRACLAPLLAPELRGTLKLLRLRDGSLLVNAETSPLTRTSPPGRVEGRLARATPGAPSVLVEATVRSPKGSLIPGVLPEGSDLVLTFGPTGPQRLAVTRNGLALLRVVLRPLR